jgi:hypothetical protein
VFGYGQQSRELVQWERSTREWALEAARHLAMCLYNGTPPHVRPYTVGLVLQEGEQVWLETPLRCNLDRPAWNGPPAAAPPPPIRPWLITTLGVVGRLDDGVGGPRLHAWYWDKCVGCQMDLTPGGEYVTLEPERSTFLTAWSGPGVAPLAVAAVFYLFGAQALLDHPGLAVLRTDSPSPPPPTATRSRQLPFKRQ